MLTGKRVLLFPAIAFVLAFPSALALRWMIVSELRVFIGEVSFWPGWWPLLGMFGVLLLFAAAAVADMWRQLTIIQRPKP